MDERLRVLIAPAATLIGIVAGGALAMLGVSEAADVVWAVTVGAMLVPLTWSVLRLLLRGDVGVDIIALLAMAGALALREYLAGAVIALMLAGGNALEAFASARAKHELTALIERAPRTATRKAGKEWERVPVEEVEVGQTLLVRAGEVIPTDGTIASQRAVIDESSLTGEPLPGTYVRGETIRSGTANAGDVFEMRASQRAADSAYAALVRLVEEAELRRAPFVRMADRYAVFFLPVTLAIAGAAWAIGADPVRALAVLVVATPCPLILAAPIAFMGGLSRSAHAGIIVKGGVAIEQLGQARTVLLDKTGTLTLGVPGVERVLALNGLGESEVLRLAASLDQLSGHVLAAAIVGEARSRKLSLAAAEEVSERPGEGIIGTVEGRPVAVGSAMWMMSNGVAEAIPPIAGLGPSDGRAEVLIGVDGRLAGAILMSDRLRPDAAKLSSRLRGCGVRHVAMVSGDRREVAEALSAGLGLDRVYAEQSPAEKVEVVRMVRESRSLRPVVMVGDGVNDAPALAAADVGVAMGSAGATVSSQTADAVIMVDRVDRVADAISIGRRTVRIAKQSVLFGIGLSVIGMGFAAAGLLVPVVGALAQEAIDVAVISNALRALGS